MQPIGDVVIKRHLRLLLALGPLVVASLGMSVDSKPLQAIIAYGYLRSTYSDFDRMLDSRTSYAFVADMRSLQAALTSVGCDLPTRLAFSHAVLVVPGLPEGQWIYSANHSSQMAEQATLFLLDHFQSYPDRVLVVLSLVAPERTTVFWLEAALKQGCRCTLLYDSFRRGSISNAPNTVIGAVTAVSRGKDARIQLREVAEPGSRPGAMGMVGRVFEIDLTGARTTLHSRGSLPSP